MEFVRTDGKNGDLYAVILMYGKGFDWKHVRMLRQLRFMLCGI